MLTIYTLMQILRLKVKKSQVLYTSEKLRSWWIQNLRFWRILATYTSMQNFRLRVKNTIKSHVIHHWKAKVMQNKKVKLWSIFRIYTFRQNIRLNIKSSVICQWKAMTIQNSKYKVWSSFENLYFHAKSQLRGVCYLRLQDFFQLRVPDFAW